MARSMAPLYDGHDYYKRMFELQEKLRKRQVCHIFQDKSYECGNTVVDNITKFSVRRREFDWRSDSPCSCESPVTGEFRIRLEFEN